MPNNVSGCLNARIPYFYLSDVIVNLSYFTTLYLTFGTCSEAFPDVFQRTITELKNIIITVFDNVNNY